MEKKQPTSRKRKDLLEITKLVRALEEAQKKDILSFIDTIKKEKPSDQDTNVQ
jgi:hypothetical protein